MRLAHHNAAFAPKPVGGYSQAVEVWDATRTLYVSGQIPVSLAGEAPPGFREQCRFVWQNLEAQLAAAEMRLENLVKVTTFLSDRRYAEENATVRREVLGDLCPALTVVIAAMFDPAWLIEIEAIAAA
jgi:enamine deaminase RidA (YjgF/YER057c/UK114 family)